MNVTQDNFLYTLTRIRQHLFAFLEAEMEKNNIIDVPPSYGHLLFILDRKGPLALKDLTRLAEKDKSTVSSMVRRLEEDGYVVKAKDQKDGRFVKIRLTQRAKRIRPLVWGISGAMNRKLFHGMTEEEKEKLFELTGKVCGNAIMAATEASHDRNRNI